MKKALLALPLLALVVACSSEAPAPEQTPSPTPTANAGPRTLVAAKLEDLQLGAKIVGPQGPEVTTVITASDGTTMGQMVSFVACEPGETEDGDPVPPTENAECDPEAQPEGAVYTYVHTIGLGEPDMEAPDPADAPQTMVFRMIKPATGFNNVIGFDAEQAQQALGEDADIKVQVEDGSLIWRVVAGDGWQDGETLTFFWQSTRPPAGPDEAYQLRIDDTTALATGPFPAPEEASTEEAAAN